MYIPYPQGPSASNNLPCPLPSKFQFYNSMSLQHTALPCENEVLLIDNLTGRGHSRMTNVPQNTLSCSHFRESFHSSKSLIHFLCFFQETSQNISYSILRPKHSQHMPFTCLKVFLAQELLLLDLHLLHVYVMKKYTLYFVLLLKEFLQPIAFRLPTHFGEASYTINANVQHVLGLSSGSVIQFLFLVCPEDCYL